MEDSGTVLATFMANNNLRKKTREKFERYVRMKAVDCSQEAELAKALVDLRRLAHAEAQARSREVHGRAPDLSTETVRRSRAEEANHDFEQARERLRRGDAKAALVAGKARTRGRKKEALTVTLTETTKEVLESMAQEALKVASHRCAPDWPCYALVVTDFVQQLDRAQPELHLLPDMRTFFASLGECARTTYGVRGAGVDKDEPKFRQLNFDRNSFALSDAVDARLTPAQRLQIKRFFGTFNAVLRAFLESLLANCPAGVGAPTWAASLRDDLTHILGPVNFKRLASFLLRYTPSGGGSTKDGKKGLSVHVDHADPVGSVLLGGSHVSAAQPCIAVYPTHETDFAPDALKPLEISYSAGDLVFFNGSFAHGSVIAVPDRLLYSQFLATSQ